MPDFYDYYVGYLVVSFAFGFGLGSLYKTIKQFIEKVGAL